jgi:putative transcription antitermination factor YqgF
LLNQHNYVLWIDLWDKRCWIAVEVQKIVLPKGIFIRAKLIPELKNLIKEYKIWVIVVWLPYDLYWKNFKQLDKTKKFIDKLTIIFPDLIIDSIDERFTSFEADIILNEMWIKDTKGKKDDISAVLILESYLKQKNKY